MIPSTQEYEERYDADVLNPERFEAEWAKWGKTRDQCIRNRRHYEQWCECGFTGAPSFDLWGWIDNGRNMKPSETIILWSNGVVESYVECLQLPNGKWISGEHWMLSISGYAGGLSIWSHQYDSRIQALSDPMLRLIERIKRDGTTNDKKHIADIYKSLDSIRQMTLFD